jgi:Putative amidoligase enzyme
MKFNDIQTQQAGTVQEKFAMSDAIDLHDELNPKLWANKKMRPEVKRALLDIAENFKSFLGIQDVEVKDITVSGSNAAFTYTPHSDLDLHLVVDIEKLDSSEVYRELFDSKKYQYNDLHDIKIRGVEVELYVQNAREPVVSLGEYSILQDKWIKEPERKPFTTSSHEVKVKYDELRTRALRALRNKSKARIVSVLDDIKRARKSGLAQGGEFSAENLAFKMLRTQGIIDKLYAAKTEQEDKELSLEAKAIAEDVQLNEINMSLSNLRRLAAAIPGARAGMEFEMIVPGASVGDDDVDWERDYDQDERCRSISDIVEFFGVDDSNGMNPNGRSELRRLQDRLESDYFDWRSEQVDSHWNNNIVQAIENHIEQYDLFDRDEVLDEIREEWKDENPEGDPDSTEAQEAIERELESRERQFVRDVLDEGPGNRIYDEAYDEYVNDNEGDYDEEEWLRDNSYRYMSDIESNYDISWPYYSSSSNGDGPDVHSIASDFESMIDRNVNASDSYHSARRDGTSYVVEPDGSLEGDDGESGLEFVSPPLPLGEMLADLAKVVKWAKSNNYYTNESTGLHINVSVPGYSLEKLDYVKLALLMGDEYVLKQFGREANTYCKAAIKFIKQKATPETIDVAMKKMKQELNTAVSKLIHSGITNKYTSINTKDSYVEFRSAGGNWLEEDLAKLESTLLRFTVALDAALDESKYKEEYAKKLYKLIAPSDDGTNTLQYFAKYSAGEIPKAALRSFIKQAQLQRQVKKQADPNKKYWWNVQKDSTTRMEVVAGSAAVARQVAAEEWGIPEERLANAIVTPLRPYEDFTPRGPGPWEIYRLSDGESLRELTNTDRQTAEREARYSPYSNPELYGIRTRQQTQAAQQAMQQQNQGNWGVWIGASQRFARLPGEYPAGQEVPIRRFSTQQAAEQFLTQTREQNPRMRTDVEVREIVPTRQPDFSQMGSNTTGSQRWQIVRISDGRQVGEFNADTHAQAEQHMERVMSNAGMDPDLYDVRPVRQPNQTSTVPGQVQQRFTGWWDVKMDDQIVFRVQAETQGEANNKAREWVQRTSPEFRQEHQGRELSVTPRYE